MTSVNPPKGLLAPRLRAFWMQIVLTGAIATPLAAEVFGPYTYEVVGETIRITDYSGGAASNVAIPAEIEGKPVTIIGAEAFADTFLSGNLTIPVAVTEIEESAFRNCIATGVTIPEGVTNIGDEAFYNCGVLKAVTIPSSVDRRRCWSMLVWPAMVRWIVPAVFTSPMPLRK